MAPITFLLVSMGELSAYPANANYRSAWRAEASATAGSLMALTIFLLVSSCRNCRGLSHLRPAPTRHGQMQPCSMLANGVGVTETKRPAYQRHTGRFVLATSYSRTTYRRTTIGAAAFHFRVRNGNGWGHCARVTRPEQRFALLGSGGGAFCAA